MLEYYVCVNMAKVVKIEGKQSATDILRMDLVKLRADVANHYAKAHESDREKYAFAKLVEVFQIGLEPYMDKEIIKEIIQHRKELQQEIQKLKDSNLSKETKNHNIILKEFEYAVPIWTLSLRIFHHSPLIEYETEGIMDPKDNKLKENVRNVSRTSNMLQLDGDAKIDEFSG